MLAGCGSGDKRAGGGSASVKETLTIMFNARIHFNLCSITALPVSFTIRFMCDTLLGVPKSVSLHHDWRTGVDATDDRTYQTE